MRIDSLPVPQQVLVLIAILYSCNDSFVHTPFRGIQDKEISLLDFLNRRHIRLVFQ
jgi:hypothetical protein